MYKIIAFLGESGCGKDYAVSYLCSKYPNIFHKVITTTTRPKRDYEIENKDYIFTTIPEFTKEVLNGNIIEATCFNEDWYYGTNIKQLNKDKVNLIVLNPESMFNLLQNEKNISLAFFYVQANDKDRLIYSLHREQNPDCKEICRRFLADKDDFEGLKNDPFLSSQLATIENTYDREFDLSLDRIAKIYS